MSWLSQFRQMLVVAKLTAAETQRQPVCLLLLALCILLTSLSPLLLLHNFGENGKLVRDSGLALQLCMGVILIGYAAGSALARERERGTIAALLSKPIHRPVLYLAKYLGVAAVSLLFSACSTMATLLAEKSCEKFYTTTRVYGYAQDTVTGVLLLIVPPAAFLAAAGVNYFFRRSFEWWASIFLFLFLTSVFLASGVLNEFGRLEPFAFQLDWRIVSCGALIALALLVFASIALALSTRLNSFSILVIMAVILLAGLMWDYFIGRFAAESDAASIAYRFFPDWQNFWMCDALNGGKKISTDYLAHAAISALSCVGAFLTFGIVSFNRSEVR